MEGLERFPLPHGELVITKGDIVRFRGDAIVNAADTKCVHGKGVDGAINRAGGAELIAERQRLPVLEGTRTRCRVGGAVVTGSGRLRSVRHVIHAVGPNFNPAAARVQPVAQDGDALLRSAYTEAMRRADETGCRTLAFSLLSAGYFRGRRPLAEVLLIAVEAIRDAAYPGLVEAHLVTFSGGERGALRAAAVAAGLDGERGGKRARVEVEEVD